MRRGDIDIRPQEVQLKIAMDIKIDFFHYD